MRRITTFLIIVVFFGLLYKPAFADSSISYVGSDLTTISSNTCIASIGGSSPKFFSIDNVNQLWGSTLTIPENDCLTISNSNSLTLFKYISQKGTNLDSLGYVDFLLSLGIYNADISVINANDQTSLAESLKAYNDLRGYNIPSSRVKDVQKELDLYNQVLSQTKSNAKTSAMFFTLVKDAMEDPQTNFATRSIVDIAIAQTGDKISKETTNALYSWEYNYIVDGNNWAGFFRGINESESANGSINVYYSQLEAAPTVNSNSVTGNKWGALVLFLVLFLVIGTVIYSRKKKLSNLSKENI